MENGSSLHHAHLGPDMVPNSDSLQQVAAAAQRNEGSY
jgi:hypothetical protein